MCPPVLQKSESKSKRQDLKTKYKIQRKVKEHNSKMRKLSKARASEGLQKRVKRDPGVPNLFPLKDRILQMAERKLESQNLYEKQLKEKSCKKTLILNRLPCHYLSRAIQTVIH